MLIGLLAKKCDFDCDLLKRRRNGMDLTQAAIEDETFVLLMTIGSSFWSWCCRKPLVWVPLNLWNYWSVCYSNFVCDLSSSWKTKSVLKRK
jgi:hypothetical protein